MKGSEFLKSVMNERNPALSRLALEEMLRGSTPPFLDERIKCFTEATIDGAYYRCDYYTMPNYLAVGDDSDFMLWPLTFVDLQAYCDAHPLVSGSDPNNPSVKFFIPPKKLIFNNWYFSTCKIEPIPLGASDQMTWPVKIGEEQAAIEAAMQANGCSIRAFNRAKKAYLTAPNMSGTDGPSKVGFLHFTGWYKLKPFGDAWQKGDSSGAHPATYADYSHGCDLVYHDVLVNGAPFEFDQICNDPKLHVLVSDQGAFVPRFPNAGLPVNKESIADAIPSMATPDGYKGPVFASSGGLVKMSASGDLPPPGLGTSESASKLPLILGLGAVAAGAYLLYRTMGSPDIPSKF
jgi:hypothetical protein